MKIYLSGPMKGYPHNNYPLFHAVTKQLRQSGHMVFNPAEYNVEPFVLREAFLAYSRFICGEADTIVLLPGWQNSLGVSAELALAKNCGLRVIEFEDLRLKIEGDLVHKHEEIATSLVETGVERLVPRSDNYPVKIDGSI